VFSVKQPGVDGCPYCQGLGRVGDDVPCPFCNSASEAVYEAGVDHTDRGHVSLFRTDEPLLYPADVDRALSNNVGHTWRAIDFEIDVEIRGQSYHVVHSDLWG
jgi:hypothetical protein